ncbi:hypothetical protein VTN77DRAFT_7441 [Rasamsonia byssochlamydoides]|uniref:uncharacterized protein n=1 Tax=Rasamsonia byssochlamydoides TaxID=89139 RepID=UPI00374244C7
MALESSDLPSQILFWCVVVFLLSIELYYMLPKSLSNRIQEFFANISSVIHDYRSGRYYKPWKSSRRIVVVSSKKHIIELSEAPVLSQRAIYADLDHHDHKVARSRLYGRLLQVNRPTNLAKLYPYLQQRLVQSLEKEIEEFPLMTVRRLASRMNSLIFFAERLCSSSLPRPLLGHQVADRQQLRIPYLRSASPLSRRYGQVHGRFPSDPVVPVTMVHSLLTNRGRAMHLIQNRLINVVGVNRQNWNELTIIHNMSEMAEGNDYWTPEVLSQALLGIWFAASHQPWMNLDSIVLELCARPEWQSILRNEIGDDGAQDYERLEKLPLLDSFIKETIRMNPLDTLAIRRKSLADFTFSDGSVHVPAGWMACVSSYDLMHDEQTYPNPEEFDGWRFVTAQSSARGTKLTEVSEKSLVWGYGSLAWYSATALAVFMRYWS